MNENDFDEVYEYLKNKGYNVYGATIDEIYSMKQEDDNLKKDKKIKNLKVLLYLISMICLFFFGATNNFLVIASNNYKMPVLADFNASLISNHHFTYSQNDNTNLRILADNIYFNNAYWSIGDLLMMISISQIATFSIFMLLYGTYLFVRRRIIKNDKNNC